MSFTDDDEIVPPPGPEPIGPGRVELDIRSNENVPLQGINQKVLLKLTGEYKSTSWLDLVVVLDVSGSMYGYKIESMIKAMILVTQKLSPMDRLSIVKYSNTAERVCKLTQMTDDSIQQLKNLINNLKAGGGTNISDGLQMGLDVLHSRKFKDGRFGVIMLMTDGQESKGDAATVPLGEVPVHTFGFGTDQDTEVLAAIAKNNPLGGTYNDVDIKNLNFAFVQCLGGLLSVVAHDVTVTITPFKKVSKINTLSAGSYPQFPDTETGSVTIKFGVLYIEEVRSVLVDLQILPIDAELDPTVLKVTYTYSFNGLPIGGNPITINVTRKSGLTPEELKAPPEVRAEEVYLLMADVVKEATNHADNDNLKKSREKISDGLKTLENTDIVQLKAELSAELKELRKLMATSEIYKDKGRSFAYSLLISLATQRQAARGEDMSQFQLFTTPTMQEFLKDAKKFSNYQEMDLKPTVRIFCQLNEDYSLSIHNGKVVLALANPQDPFQHWIKEEVDGGGFTLFNKVTAQAMKRSPNISSVNNQVIEVLLVSMPFGSNNDSDAVWTESNEGGNTFGTVFGKHGDRQGFRLQPHSRLDYDGNTVLLTNQGVGPYQKWKFVPYFENRVVCPKTIKIYCRNKTDYNLTICDDTVVFAQGDQADPYQHWSKEFAYCQHLKDEQGFQAFAIVNVATGKAIQHGISQGYGYPVSLLPFNPMQLDESLLWTESEAHRFGFKKIKIRKNIGVGLDIFFNKECMQEGLQEGMCLGVWVNSSAQTHEWKMEEFF